MHHGGLHVLPVQQQGIEDNTDKYIDNQIIDLLFSFIQEKRLWQNQRRKARRIVAKVEISKPYKQYLILLIGSYQTLTTLVRDFLQMALAIHPSFAFQQKIQNC